MKAKGKGQRAKGKGFHPQERAPANDARHNQGAGAAGAICAIIFAFCLLPFVFCLA